MSKIKLVAFALFLLVPGTVLAERHQQFDPSLPYILPAFDPEFCWNEYLSCLDQNLDGIACFDSYLGCLEATIEIFPEIPNAPEPELFEPPIIEEEPILFEPPTGDPLPAMMEEPAHPDPTEEQDALPEVIADETAAAAEESEFLEPALTEQSFEEANPATWEVDSTP